MSTKIKPHKVFELFYDEKGRRLYTQNLLPGRTHFSERTYREKNIEYREFDPTRSKLAAAVVKGATNIGLRKGDAILYLGASHGYTISFVSDMVGTEGMIFGIDPAPRVMRDLVFLSEQRKNIVPILADANHPEEYETRICGVDIVYQDIAQKNQAEIFLENCRLFLKKGGYGLLAVKARSIDAKRKSKQIFEEIRRKVEKELTVIDYRVLEPLEKDHCMIIVKK
ncbi:fibrillarin-like rRNA/tRNA 2'-O-methyltransferase [Candidatus Woesearchaeota archaeon]|nr:fibrillarin-like rRNA/tRNA 2'-O-methyltransferase [Candidatus Woesearchaeota archaeon]